MVSREDVGVVLWAGDSRLYRVRGMQLELITRDHNPIADLLDSGAVSEADALKADCQAAMMIGSRVEVRQYPGDDELDTVVFRDIDDWIMRTVLPEDTAIRDRWVTSPTSYSPN